MVDEIPLQLSKELKSEMKDVVNECTEEIFNKWIEGEIMHDNFDIRKNILKLSEKEFGTHSQRGFFIKSFDKTKKSLSHILSLMVKCPISF
jgi:hypothetical protein